MSFENITNKLNNKLFEYTNAYDEKLTDIGRYVTSYKSRYSNNVTIEDWNLFIKQVSDLHSDSAVQHAFIQSLSNTLVDAFNFIKTMNSTNSNFYSIDEIDSKFETKVNASYEHDQIYHTISTNDTLVREQIEYKTSYTLATAKEYTNAKFTVLENTLKGIMDGSEEAYNSFIEISNYIKADQSAASEMLSKINKNTSDIANLKLTNPEVIYLTLRDKVSSGTTERVLEIEISGIKYALGENYGPEISTLYSRLSDLKKDVYEEFDTTRNIIDENTSRIEDLESNVDSMNTTLGDLETEVSEVSGKFNLNKVATFNYSSSSSGFTTSGSYRLSSSKMYVLKGYSTRGSNYHGGLIFVIGSTASGVFTWMDAYSASVAATFTVDTARNSISVTGTNLATYSGDYIDVYELPFVCN